ncbi:coenzyme Q biosynthesis protein Coq4, partial [Colletotrichum musicola]
MKALRALPTAPGRRAIPAICAACTSTTTPSRPFSVLNRPPPNYEGHVPLTKIER